MAPTETVKAMSGLRPAIPSGYHHIPMPGRCQWPGAGTGGFQRGLTAWGSQAEDRWPQRIPRPILLGPRLSLGRDWLAARPSELRTLPPPEASSAGPCPTGAGDRSRILGSAEWTCEVASEARSLPWLGDRVWTHCYCGVSRAWGRPEPAELATLRNRFSADVAGLRKPE